MKKIFMLFAAMFAVSAIMAQTPTLVSTQVENRNVILEEYTGIGCGYCPDGHAMGNTIMATYPGHAWAINIHQGGYATGSGYETQWGDALANQYNITGYPSATINRGSSATSSRSSWQTAAGNIREQVSPVNVGASAVIDPTTRTLTVNVELYYTGSQTVNSNYLNVVLLQDSVLGPQSNYGNYNADYITADGQYYHMHMLRDMLTGQWGEEITTISEGTLVQRTYTYTLPTTIGAVDLVFSHLSVIAFVTETHKNILSGAEAEMMVLPGAYMAGFAVDNSDCDLTFHPYITVSNTFAEDITSWVFDYDGQMVTSNKTVASGNMDTIHMPDYTVVVNGQPVQSCLTTKSAALVSYVKDGLSFTVNSPAATISFADFNIYTVAGPITARVGVDAWRSEASVQFLNQSNCQVLWAYTNFGSDVQYSAQQVSQLPNATYYDFTISPETAGLYIFRAVDSYGDGWPYTNNNNKSGIWITDVDGNECVSLIWGYAGSPSFENYDIYLNFTNAGDGSHTVGIDEVVEAHFSIYPNPTVDRLNISSAETVREVNVIDMAGRTVINAGATNSINVSGLAAGIYMVRVATENGIGMQKFVKE